MEEYIVPAMMLVNKETIQELTLKLLGPSFEYAGNIPPRIAEYTLSKIKEIEIYNLKNIFCRAEKKMASNGTFNLDTNLRIVRGVVEQGIYAQDEVMVEYFAGILASSKTEDGMDDTCVPYLQMIKSLSSFDLKLHCFIYKTIYNEYKGLNYRFATQEDRDRMNTHVCIDDLFKNANMKANDINFLIESLFRLIQNELISENFKSGQPISEVKKLNPQIEQIGISFSPSLLGAKVFMSAYGYGCESVEKFFELEYEDDLEIKPANNPCRMVVTK